MGITENNKLIAEFMGVARLGATVYARLNEQTGATDFLPNGVGNL